MDTEHDLDHDRGDGDPADDGAVDSLNVDSQPGHGRLQAFVLRLSGYWPFASCGRVQTLRRERSSRCRREPRRHSSCTWTVTHPKCRKRGGLR